MFQDWRRRELVWVAVVCLGIAAVVLLIYGQTGSFGFVNYDDPDTISPYNEVVDKGVTWHGIDWAFTTFELNNWVPLAWLSHMVVCQFFGVRPGAHHLANVELHAAVAMLLFVVLREMTGSLWRSAFVAALFAVHPLRVESVAWVSERKDLLAGVFFTLTIWAYVKSARGPRPSRRFIGVILLYTLGLLSKPTLVTLPFLLLLLDDWPLGRFKSGSGGESFRQLFLEKVPLLILAGAACVVTVFSQGDTEVFDVDRAVSLWGRLGNAAVSYFAYIRDMVYPARLALNYPYPIHGLPGWEVILAFVGLIAISAGVVAIRRKQPYLFTGWFWYLGMLVPMIGILQAGPQSRADRYTYLAQIGLGVCIVWGVAEWCGKEKWRRILATAGGLAILAVLAIRAHTQTGFWKDSPSLWEHALACTTDNHVAETNMGVFLLSQGRKEEALEHFEKAAAINPRMLMVTNASDELLRLGRAREAIPYLEQGLALEPGNLTTLNNLAYAYWNTGNPNEAIRYLRKEAEEDPSNISVLGNLGFMLFEEGEPREAIRRMEKVERLRPEDQATACLLAWMLATSGESSVRDGVRAVELGLKADRLAGGKDARALEALAAAYAETGRFSEAMETAQRALDLVREGGKNDLLGSIKEEMACYAEKRAFHH